MFTADFPSIGEGRDPRRPVLLRIFAKAFGVADVLYERAPVQ